MMLLPGDLVVVRNTRVWVWENNTMASQPSLDELLKHDRSLVLYVDMSMALVVTPRCKVGWVFRQSMVLA